MSLHNTENFPEIIREIVTADFIDAEVFRIQVVGKEAGGLPAIGQLYLVNDTVNEKSDWFYHETWQNIDQETKEIEECEREARIELKLGESVLVLDYLVAKLSRGYNEHNKRLATWTFQRPVYTILVKALYDHRMVYRSFLWTPTYSEFESVMKLVQHSATPGDSNVE